MMNPHGSGAKQFMPVVLIPVAFQRKFRIINLADFPYN